MKSATRPAPALRLTAWCAVLIGSALPEIIWRTTGHAPSLWPSAIQCIVLVVVACAVFPSPRLRPLTRFLLVVAALHFGWYFVAPWIGATEPVHTWSQNADWGDRLIIGRTVLVAGVILMSLTLVGSGLSRRDLYLCKGDLAAPAQPVAFLGMRKPIRWTVFGPALLVVFGVALPLFLYFTIRPDFTASGRIAHFLPWILAIAVLNAANEEFQFRCVFLGHLRNIMTPGEAVLLTAVLFGIGHYYGQPSGPIGVVMAGFAGWIWGRSMIETGGFAWAFFIHTVQDIVIFCFLVLGTGK